MAEASLAAQRLAVATMRAHAALTALVPAANILDRHARPEVFPCILVGEGSTAGADTDCHDLSEVALTIHVWTRETGFAACKQIAGTMRRALRDVSAVQDGFDLSFNYSDSVWLRDPSGNHAHGVVRFDVLAEDTVGIV